MDLQEIFLHLIETSFHGPTPHMRTITRRTEDHMINAQISPSIDMIDIHLKMDLLTNRMGTGEQMGIFLVHHRLKEETSDRINPIVNQEVINLTTLRPLDKIIDLRLVLHPMNKNFRRTMIRHHLMWFASLRPMIP